MYKNITLKEECQKKLLSGAAIVAEAVGTTFGRKGRNVIIQNPNPRAPSKITKDGVSVAREIRLEDEKANLGAKEIIDVSLRLLEKVGDGTTTSILLANAFFKYLVIYNLSANELSEYKALVENLIAKFNEISIPATDPELLEGVANIASNGDTEITSIVKSCVEHTGDKGNILVNLSQNQSTTVSHESGIYVPFGYVHEKFANNKLRKVGEFSNAYLMIVNETIVSLDQIIHVLNQLLSTTPETPIVIIANGFGEDVIVGLLGNLQHGHLKIAAISIDSKDQAADDLLHDISVLTGSPLFGKQYNRSLGMHKNGIKLSELKIVENCHISDESTVILPSNLDEKAVADHITILTERMNNSTDDKVKEYLSLRIGRLSQKVSIIKVGGLTKQLASEKKDRFEDAVCATMQALKFGVLPGGGMPLALASDSLFGEICSDEESSDSNKAKRVLIKAFDEVLTLLYRNSAWGSSLDECWKIVDENDFSNPKEWIGLDLGTDLTENLFESRILDATSVITESLRTASAVAISLYNTETMITGAKTIDYEMINSNPIPGMPG